MRRRGSQDSTRRRGSVLRYASTSYAGALLGVVTGPIIARTLGPVGRGEYAAVSIYSGVCASLLALGMTLTVDYAILNLRLDPRHVLGVVLRFCALLILPSFVAAFGAYSLLQDYSDASRIGALIFLAVTPLAVLQLCLNSFLLAESALGSLTKVRLTPLLFNAAGVIGFAVSSQLTLTSYLGLTFVGSMLTLGITVRAVGVRPQRGGRLAPQLRHGLRAYLGSLAYVGNMQLDQVLIAPVLGAPDLGFYAVAVTMANLPLGVVQALVARAMMDMATVDGGFNPESTAAIVRRSIVLSAICTLAVALIIPFFVPLLYGKAFEKVVGLGLVLLIGTVALGITIVATAALNVAGRPSALSVAELVGLGATAAGLIVLMPVLGVMGAAIASALAYWIRAGAQLVALRQAGVTDLAPRRADLRDAWEILARRGRSARRRAREE